MASETFKFDSVYNAEQFITHLKTNGIRGTFDFSNRPYTVTVLNVESITQQVRNLAKELEKEAYAYSKQISTAPEVKYAERIVKPRYEQLKEFSDQFKKKQQIDVTDESDDIINRIQAETDIIRNYSGTGDSTTEINYLAINDNYGILRNDWFTIITNLKYPLNIVQNSKFVKGLGDYEPVAFLYLNEARKKVYGLAVQHKNKANNYYGYFIDVSKNSVNEISIYTHELKDMVKIIKNAIVSYYMNEQNKGITSPPKPSPPDASKKKF